MEQEISQTTQKENSTNYNIHRKIFVGNISYRVRSRRLSKFFSKFGAVEYCYIVKDHLKKWSRGIAFITFKTEESMRKALVASDEELKLDDRQMRVKEAELSSKTKYWQDSAEMSGDDDDDDDDWDDQVVDRSRGCNVSASENTVSNTDLPGHEHLETTEMEHSDVSTASYVTVNSLLDELLISIFSLLTVKERIRIERVCTRWRHLAQRAWTGQRTLKFQNMFKRFVGLTDKNLNSVLCRCGQYLHCLDLSGSPRMLTDFAMDIIAKQCPELLQLDLTSVKITDKSLKNLVSQGSKLQEVRLKMCLHITDQGIHNLLRGTPDMQHLDLTDLQNITGQCFQCAGDKLNTLVLNNCHKMQDSSVQILGRRCVRLEHLLIGHCWELSLEAVRCITKSFPNLKSLHYSRPGQLVESQALLGLENLKNLELLDLSNGHGVNDAVLTAVAHACKNLRALNISSCNNVTDVGVSTLRQCERLESLDISYLNKISGETLLLIAIEGRLKKLVARATNFLTDEGVVTVAEMCPRLHHLDLSGCFHITNRIFDGFKSGPIHDSHTVDLFLGGTSVDWIGQDVDWLSGFSHLQVFMHNLAMEDLRPDRQLILPEYSEYSSDEEAHVDQQDNLPGLPPEAVEGHYDDWDEEDYGQGGYDEYLDNDDPLEEERWDMS